MADEGNKRDRSKRDAETANSNVNGDEPFETSRSGGDYDPNSNWAEARRGENAKGDGGYGPEGDYSGKAGIPNEEILGDVRGSNERLVDQSRKAVEEGRTPQRTEPDKQGQ